MKKSLLILFILINHAVFAQTYGIIGDAGHWNEYSKNVRDSILHSGVKKLILPGDNIYDTSLQYTDVWGPWLSENLKPFVVGLGNHHRSIEEEIEFFNMPGKYYSIIEQSIRFIVLDSETLSELDEQAIFLKRELEKSEETFNVVVFHHPPATVSYRHGWKEREAFHLKMKPIFDQFNEKISLIINGHDHIASLFTFGEIPVVVSGAVFETRPAPAFSYTRELDGVKVKTVWGNSEGFYWVRLDFDPKRKRIWVNFVRSDEEQVSCSILLLPKQILRRQNCFENGIRGEALFSVNNPEIYGP